MKTFRTRTRTPLPKQQQGASLFIALIILLVVTVLAMSSAREAALESRISGNYIEQQRLANSAEAGLRDAENTMRATSKPREPQTVPNCESTQPCFLSTAVAYAQDFTQAQDYAPTDASTLERTTKWYSQVAPSGEAEGQAENPEYGNPMLGIGTFRYEVNSQAANTAGAQVSLRSVTAKVFN
ncbi:MAG: hypothetical protein A2Y50_12190 [Pseudomonadales bacterium RIFCSPLOWO2_12_59_9]|nr:MAG: hypothetical protein A2Y50_12190 [Pseudomonadales bacterium RIFCSPLOWO2_12_59_9]